MRIRNFLLPLLIALFVWGCGKKEPDVIKIGVSLPLTGDAAVWGTQLKDGYDLALDQINAAGGINGKKVELLYGDDKGVPKDGVSVLEKLIATEKIKVLTGVANSSVALAMIPIIERDKIIFVSSGASSPKLSGASKYFFRTWPSDIAEALAMARFAYENLSFRKAGILYINNEYGIGLKEPFTKRFEELGGKVSGAESFEQNASDFKAQIIKVKSLNSDFVYLAGNPREMARCIKQMRELGLKQQILGISTLNEKEVLEITGKAIEGVMFTDVSYDPNSPTEETQKFIKEFEAKFNKKPGILAITAYDALMVLRDAIEKNGLDPEKIVNHLKNLKDFQGASGKIAFDENGDVKRNVRIAVVKDGKFETELPAFTW